MKVKTTVKAGNNPLYVGSAACNNPLYAQP
jgi:hypothetical protein